MNLERPKDVTTRDPSQITDVLGRVVRHFFTMERYVLAGKKHTWLAMSRDALEAISILNTNLRNLMGEVKQLQNDGRGRTDLSAVTTRLDAMDKRLRSIMQRQEDIDAKLEG